MSLSPSAGTLYLIDTSAFARIGAPSVRNVIAGLIAEGVAATCVTVDLEAGYSGRTADEVRAIAENRRTLYRNLPITEQIAEQARQVQLRMAARGQHRAAGIVDVLTAAVAEHHGAVILHYDADFEHIAAVTGQQHLWIAPRGSL
ncbi:MAG: Ribonuclease VapC2 [Microbacteriaceae bacterium]|nr:Ribonuclease VapC2 [Microbacteriaceae bacterium]